MSVWKSLGFSNSPYDANPLRPVQEDVDFLVGRNEETTELCTALEAGDHGFLFISGVPGVGKTSFFNVTQFLLESSQAPFGRHLMCARRLCPIHPGATAISVARSALANLIKSVEDYCRLANRPIPSETQKLSKWVGDVGSGGYQIGVTILGCGGSLGRNVSLPKFSEASFEKIVEAYSVVTAEIVVALNFQGAFMVLDNIENLEERHCADLLLAFRDTLFTCPNLWWIIIGQSGLASLIKTLEPRVFERSAGIGLELKPISLRLLHEAIEKRVHRFHASGDGNAPLPEVVHKHLYHASHGEIRFVFKYSNDICFKFITAIRQGVLDSRLKHVEEALNESLGRALVQAQIPEQRAEKILRLIIETELTGLNLKQKEKELLRLIGHHGSARASEFKKFGLKSSQDFSSNFLSKFFKLNLLRRTQEGRSVVYKLRGMSALASEYSLLTD